MDVSSQFHARDSRHPPTPEMDFPKFNGENPRLWKDHCEVYFEVYSIGDPLKCRFASLNFEGAVATWLQIVELRGRFTSWPALCSVVCEKFDRDQYPLCMRQLDNLKQSGIVAEFFEKFQKLAHQILLYNNSYDDVYFVTRFMSGLREDVRAPIMLHRPKDLKTAYSLALLQEEELQQSKASNAKWDSNKTQFPSANDKYKPVLKKEEIKRADKTVLDDKWSTLKSYQRANGLCFVCGEKWQGKNHKCPEQVPVHMVQELLEMFQLSADPESDMSDTKLDTEQVMLSVEEQCKPELLATKKRKTMRFQGFIGKQELLILLDSGSTTTFISKELAAKLSQQEQECPPLKYTAANGSPMLCDTYIPQLQWFIQGHSFSYDARVLPLSGFDMIIGADWLEDHSPMWIHQKKKILSLPHKGKRIRLRGLQPNTSKC